MARYLEFFTNSLTKIQVKTKPIKAQSEQYVRNMWIQQIKYAQRQDFY